MIFLTTPGAGDVITLNADPTEAERAGTSGGIGHFGFRRKDSLRINEAIREVEAAGGRLIQRGEHAPGAPFAYVADPDGYMIEL